MARTFNLKRLRTYSVKYGQLICFRTYRDGETLLIFSHLQCEPENYGLERHH